MSKHVKSKWALIYKELKNVRHVFAKTAKNKQAELSFERFEKVPILRSLLYFHIENLVFAILYFLFSLEHFYFYFYLFLAQKKKRKRKREKSYFFKVAKKLGSRRNVLSMFDVLFAASTAQIQYLLPQRKRSKHAAFHVIFFPSLSLRKILNILNQSLAWGLRVEYFFPFIFHHTFITFHPSVTILKKKISMYVRFFIRGLVHLDKIQCAPAPKRMYNCIFLTFGYYRTTDTMPSLI